MSTKEDVASFLARHNSFVIASHINPDGDALGSTLALSLALDLLGKKNIVYNRDGVPSILAFLPQARRVRSVLLPKDTEGSTLLLLDCNSPERAALEEFAFTHTIVIDHHETEKDFGELRWVEIDNPATGLMVLELIRKLGVELTKDMAQNIYTALAVDTGTFRFPNTTPAALRAAADLVEAGAEPGFVADRLYQAWSEKRYELFMRNLRTTEKYGPVAVNSITTGMFRETDTRSVDTDNFVNFPLIMDGIKVSALIRESEDSGWKVSLRSKGDVNVAKVAERFGGGGHQNAAGCTIKGELESVKQKLLEAIRALPNL